MKNEIKQDSGLADELSEDDIAEMLAKASAPYAKNKGSSGLTAWCKAHGVNKAHASEFVNRLRAPGNDLLDALGIRRAYIRRACEVGSLAQADVCRLDEAPIGLFMCNGELCLKTEYREPNGFISAFIVSTGEFFAGPSPQDVTTQNAASVRPLTALPKQDSALADEFNSTCIRDGDRVSIPAALAPRILTALRSGDAELLRDMLKAAYVQGATDVHNEWSDNPLDADFGEAGDDYAAAKLNARLGEGK